MIHGKASQTMTLKDIAAVLGGELLGDGAIEITGVSGITDAQEGDITYLSGTKWLKAAKESRAAAILVKEPVKDIEKAQIKIGNPQYAFAKLLSLFYVKPYRCEGVSGQAFVSDEAVVGEEVTIYPFAYVADGAVIGKRSIIHPGVFVGRNSSIGEGSLLYPNVVVREGITIGSRVIIHAGAVIGADGYGYVFEEGSHQKIPQIGGVIVEDDVEIGANTTIDRATTGNTIIGRGTKIDNLVQVGHNVRIGKNALIIAQVGIAGSSEIGDGVVLAGQVGIADHVTIEAGTMLGAQSGVMGDLKRGIYSGYPAIPHKDWLKASALVAQLPELRKKVRELEQRIAALSK